VRIKITAPRDTEVSVDIDEQAVKKSLARLLDRVKAKLPFRIEVERGTESKDQS